MKLFLIIVTVICVLAAACLLFCLGGRWEAYSIQLDLQKTGQSISRTGDNSFILITGDVEPYFPSMEDQQYEIRNH